MADDEAKKPKENPFSPYPTMFKKVNRSRLRGFISKEPHAVECVSCRVRMPMKTYLDNKDILEVECTSCHVKAFDYWKGSVHQEVPDAEERD